MHNIHFHSYDINTREQKSFWKFLTYYFILELAIADKWNMLSELANLQPGKQLQIKLLTPMGHSDSSWRYDWNIYHLYS